MSSIIHSQAADIPSNMTTTGFDVPGFRIVDNLGVVRGVVGHAICGISPRHTWLGGFMTRLGIIIGLSLALTGCTQSPKEETKKVPYTFSDNGAAASQRISRSLQEPAVAAKLRNCLSQLKGQGLVATDLTYRKSGNSWTFDSVKVTKASLAQAQDATVQKCMEESARGTSFSVDSNQELETAAAEFVVRLGWSLPLPPEGTEVTNDAIARMIGTGGVITMEGCSTCQLRTDGSGSYQCIRKTSGNEVDCEVIGANACATTPKACVSGFFGGTRGVVMF